ncbi:MAG: ABC transporter permease, partial [Nannocystaceae bacterium]|nr:ABC transporter permease [Nannocystaceae bacterium]
MKRLLEEFLDNLRFGARTLWNAKVFTTIAVVCLALGIGGTTAIFSVVKTVLLDPLPYPEPERLVAVEFGPSPRSWSWSMPLVDLLAEHQTSFESVGGFRPMQYNVSTTGEAVQVPGAQVTPGFLAALAIEPVVGLCFTQDDDRTTADPVAMISYEFSERVFDHPTAALGEPLWVDGSAYTIVGVLPPGFGEIWDHADVLLPPGRLRDSFPLNHFGAQRFTVVGRLSPESTVASAQAQLSGLPTQIIERWPQIGQTGGFTIELKPLDETMVGDSKDTLWLLMAAVVSVLLIAAANVANLLLARANVRVRETAIRHALGASASSMVRQHLTEGLLLGLIGGAAGLVVASWGVELLAQEATDLLPMVGRIRLDLPVLAFTAAVSIAAAVGFSLVPAVASVRTELTGPLKTGGAGRGARGSRTTQNWIVGGEVALALILVVGAGLSLRTMRQLNAVNLGFQTD